MAEAPRAPSGMPTMDLPTFSCVEGDALDTARVGYQYLRTIRF